MSEAEAPKDVLLRLAHELCRCYAADDWDDTNPTFEDILTSMVLVAQQPVRAKLDAARAQLAASAALVTAAREYAAAAAALGDASVSGVVRIPEHVEVAYYAAENRVLEIARALAVQPAESEARRG